MATSSRRSPKVPGKRGGKPFFRFYHSESLRAQTLAVITSIEKAKDGRPHREALAQVVVELSDRGMEYFFLRPLKLAKMSFLVQQSANLGMAAASGIMASAVRSIIGRMDHAQLLAICSYMRQLME